MVGISLLQDEEDHTSVMIQDQEKIIKIKKLLKSRPRGLTISDISHTLKLNRNSVAKYLEILLITGEVEVRLYGNAKVYSLAQRVPISSLLRFATELILILDSDFRVIDVNDNFLSFFSLGKDDLVGTNVRTSGNLGIGELFSGIISGEENQLTGRKQEINLSIAGKDCTLAYKVVPTVFDNGARGYTLIFDDVTVARDFEKKLSMSEERYRAIVEDQTELICRFDPGFCFTFVNSAVSNYLGQPTEEILGKDMLSFVSTCDRDMVRQNILSLGPGHEVETHEQRVTGPSGEIRWQQWTNRAIIDISGRIVEYQGVGRDITERKLDEERLQVLNMAVSSSINGIAIATLDGRITHANNAFLRIFGIPRLEDILNQSLAMLDARGHQGHTLGDMMQGMRERGEWTEEMVVCRNDGTRSFILCTGDLVMDPGCTPIAIMVSLVDITERVEAEQELRIKNTAIEADINSIFIFDTNGHLIYANQSFFSMFGVTDLEGMHQKRMDLFWLIADSIAPPVSEIERILYQDGRWSGEIRAQVPGYGPRFYQCSATLVKDQGGNSLCIICVLMDTTGQKAIEKALKTVYEKLQEAVEFMPDPTFILGRERRVIAWNRAMEVLSGIKREEVLGSDRYADALAFLQGAMPILVDILGKSAHDLARAYPSVRKFGDSIYVEAKVPASKGRKEKFLWAKATPLFDGEGNIIGAIESFRDISEWKKARESLLIPGYKGQSTSADHEGSGVGDGN